MNPRVPGSRASPMLRVAASRWGELPVVGRRQRGRADHRPPGRSRSLLGLVLALGAACSPGEPAPTTPPQRIVLLVIDTLRRDHVEPYGDAAETPHLARLAREGQVFTRYEAAYHQTTMSMASLFTGHTPSLERGKGLRRLSFTGRTWCGLLRFSDPDEPDDCIPRTVPTLAERMRKAGYETLGITTNSLLFEPGGYARGFDVWHEVKADAPVAVLGNLALREVLARRRSDRFFLYHHFMDVHDHDRLGLTYAEAVSQADRGVGEMLHVLELEGLREGAVILVTSDHGERLGETHFTEGMPGHNGNPSFQPLLEVPLIVSPAVFEGAERRLRTDELHRRILALAGAGVGPEPELGPEEHFVSELRYQTYRNGRYKLFRSRRNGAVSLVDLAADPRETRNVADAHPDVVAELSRRLDGLSRDLGEPEAPDLRLSAEDRERLRAIGYVRFQRMEDERDDAE